MSKDWQDIESAPKDGTKILAVGDGVRDRPRMMWDDSEPRVTDVCVIWWSQSFYDAYEESKDEPGCYQKVKKQGWAYWAPDPQQFRPRYWRLLPALPVGFSAPDHPALYVQDKPA